MTRPVAVHSKKSFNWKYVPLLLSLGAPVLSVADPADTLADGAIELHKKGQFDAAAQRGLSDLLTEPSNHALRFIVADSLQRSGKIEEAIAQFQALEGTPFASTATMRLNALRTYGQAPARKLAVSPDGATQLMDSQPGASSGADLSANSRLPGLMPTITAGTPLTNTPAAPARSPAAQRVAELNAAGDYQSTGTQGMALLSEQKTDDELQLIIANSLAWTGRLKEAIPVYQGLTSGKYAKEGRIGVANMQRWRGRDDQAAPIYREVLATDPTNAGAIEGLKLSSRELNPRTLVSAGASVDSSDMQRRAATVNHRWRDSSGTQLYEIEASGVRDRLPTAAATQQDVTLRYQSLALVLKPSFELSMPTKADNTVYAGVRLKLDDDQATVEIGRVNWGRIASNPNALASHLAALHLGLESIQKFSFGNITGRADYYDISDGNNILNSSLRFASSWRPLGNNIKPFASIDTRSAKFNTPNYWSPAQGFGSLSAGVLGEWGSADWNVYTSGQVGRPLYGEAGNSWSLTLGGKQWLSDDIAIGINLWSMASRRDDAAYRAKAVTINVEKLWR